MGYLQILANILQDPASANVEGSTYQQKRKTFPSSLEDNSENLNISNSQLSKFLNALSPTPYNLYVMNSYR